MPRTATVGLSVVASSTSPDATYSECLDSGGTAIAGYWYLFSGGDDTNGNVTSNTPRDQVNVEVTLLRGSHGQFDILRGVWKLGSEPISTNPDIEFILHPGGNKVEIVDRSVHNGEDVGYSVVAVPKNSTTPELFCDPRVSNNWVTI